MYLQKLWLDGFRNLADGAVRFSPGVNLVLGGNGHGKSNLLEAVAVLGTLRSFRASSLRRVVRHGSARAVIGGQVQSRDALSNLGVEVLVGSTVERRQVVNGRSCPVEEYLPILPVEVLTGRQEDLVSGEPQIRRSFLDRLAFQLRPAVLVELRRYRSLLQQRNARLRAGARGLDGVVWEQELARAAADVVVLRKAVVEALRPHLDPVFREVAADKVSDLEIVYRPESWLPEAGRDELAEIYEKRYASARERDERLGFTGHGPHRHDLGLVVGGRPAAEVLSSGQAKLVAASLRLAARAAAEDSGNGDAIAPILMDDADAELDGEALVNLLSRVRRGRQVILSSPRGDAIRHEVRPDAVLWLRDGSCLSGLDVETRHDESVHS